MSHYKAFVASTREDLAAHRERVVEALEYAAVIVDPMERWSADSGAPRDISPARLEGCNLCILLVAYRRGEVPPGETRSITQLEYEAARKGGVEVLPFLLDESPETEALWDPRFDERGRDPEVRAWRERLRREHTVQFFGASPDSIRIEPALARWVVETESRRAHRFRIRVYAAAAAMIGLILAAILYVAFLAASPEARTRYLSRLLALHDPVVFNHSPKRLYEIARVLTYTTQRKETNLSSEILGTTDTFDILVNNAAIIHYDQRENFLSVVKRGGHVRMIVWDFSESNPTYVPFCRAINQTPESNRADARELYDDLLRLREEIAADHQTYRGTLDFRVNPRPLLYTMWIRDWNRPQTALGHLAVHLYKNQSMWPTIRVSHTDSPNMLANLHEEFEYAWRTSLPSQPVRSQPEGGAATPLR